MPMQSHGPSFHGNLAIIIGINDRSLELFSIVIVFL